MGHNVERSRFFISWAWRAIADWFECRCTFFARARVWEGGRERVRDCFRARARLTSSARIDSRCLVSDQLGLILRHSRSRRMRTVRVCAFDACAPLGGGSETARRKLVFRCAEGMAWDVMLNARGSSLLVGHGARLRGGGRSDRKETQTKKEKEKELATRLRTFRFVRTRGVRDRLGAWARRRSWRGERAPVARGPAGARFASGLGLSPENASSLFLPKTRALSLSRSPELGRLKGEEVWEVESVQGRETNLPLLTSLLIPVDL